MKPENAVLKKEHDNENLSPKNRNTFYEEANTEKETLETPLDKNWCTESKSFTLKGEHASCHHLEGV